MASFFWISWLAASGRPNCLRSSVYCSAACQHVSPAPSAPHAIPKRAEFRKQTQLSLKDVELAVKSVIEQMSNALTSSERIEIRGFGSFSLHYREPRQGRNPKTGDAVQLPGKFVPHFKPGKELRERVNKGLKLS